MMLTEKIMSDLALGLEHNCDTDYDCVVVLKAVLTEALGMMPDTKRRKLYESATFQKAIKGILNLNQPAKLPKA
jgi:hypothetical protein